MHTCTPAPAEATKQSIFLSFCFISVYGLDLHRFLKLLNFRITNVFDMHCATVLSRSSRTFGYNNQRLDQTERNSVRILYVLYLYMFCWCEFLYSLNNHLFLYIINFRTHTHSKKNCYPLIWFEVSIMLCAQFRFV